MEDVINHIILNSRFKIDPGLYEGKSGLILFFFNYGHITSDYLYTEIAYDLLEDLYDNLDINLPIGFGYGLSGIAWTIAYLYEYGYVEGNVVEVLKDIDEKILSISFQRYKDLSMENGLDGILEYIKSRLYFSYKYQIANPFKTEIINEIESISFLNEKINNGLKISYIKEYDFNHILLSILNKKMELTSISEGALGLKYGWAGYLLNKCMNETNNCNK